MTFMKIFYSPHYVGQVYLVPTDGNVMMDCKVSSTPALLELLSLRLGLHWEPLPTHEAITLYYGTMKSLMPQMPDSVLSQSFALADLPTAAAALRWRNELRMAGCQFSNGGTPLNSSRLNTLFALEDTYRNKIGDRDLAGHLANVMQELDTQKPDCSVYEIHIPYPLDWFSPAERKLLEKLKGLGATITEQNGTTAADCNSNLSRVCRMLSDKNAAVPDINPDDRSLQVFEFADEHAAHEYLSYYEMADVDVWINPDNKQMDNWLYRMGKPLTGSEASGGFSRIEQMLMLGVSLFRRPLDLNMLLVWLDADYHPLPAFFRSLLARKIAKKGGYRNDACEEVINKYINGEYEYLTEEQKSLSVEEQALLRQSGKTSREELVNVYLPYLSKKDEDKVDVRRLRSFVEKLGNWAVQRAGCEKDKDALAAEQLYRLSAIAVTFNKLLDIQNTTELSQQDFAKLFDVWMGILYRQQEVSVCTVAQQGCRTVVNSPAHLISTASKTVWMHVDGDNFPRLQLDFLYPSELEELKKRNLIDIWDETAQNNIHWAELLNPLRRTSGQLILVTCRHRGGESAQKHPLIVRLEQQLQETKPNDPKEKINHYAKLVREPKIDTGQIEQVVPSVKTVPLNEITVNRIAAIPQEQSATSIESLVCHPFEYVMDKILEIKPDEKVRMNDVRTTKGNVAHGVIETLFAPRGGQPKVDAAEIEKRIGSEYDNAFKTVVESKGAVLQLNENLLECQLLQRELKGCLTALHGIIKENGLSVVGCEQYCQHSEKNSDKIVGFMDMTLEDATGNPVVFDFKWTSSKSYYNGLLEKNRSIQLEIYRYLLSQSSQKNVKAAYFLMPQAHLFSKELFNGENCTQIIPGNTADIIPQLMNSIGYRKEQLQNGIIEMQGVYDDLQYVKDTAAKNLFPLEMEEDKDKKAFGQQKPNPFSKYELFQ